MDKHSYHWTAFEFLPTVVFFSAFVIGVKTGIIGVFIGLVVGVVLALLCRAGAIIFVERVFLPLGRRTEQTSEDGWCMFVRWVLIFIGWMLTFVIFAWVILCALAAFKLTKFLLTIVGSLSW